MANTIGVLMAFLAKVPGVSLPIDTGKYEKGLWWVKFQIDIDHALAWQVVQELSTVVNYLSENERLPARFYPVSPPAYLNGGPAECLRWIIEATDAAFTPKRLAEWLEARLPSPVDELPAWEMLGE